MDHFSEEAGIRCPESTRRVVATRRNSCSRGSHQFGDRADLRMSIPLTPLGANLRFTQLPTLYHPLPTIVLVGYVVLTQVWSRLGSCVVSRSGRLSPDRTYLRLSSRTSGVEARTNMITSSPSWR